MTLVSLPFFLFVAALICIYYIAPEKYRWIVLLVGSYFFYWTNSKWLLFILLATTLVTYAIGLWTQKVSDRAQAYLKEHAEELSREDKKRHKENTKKVKKRIMLLGVLLDLGALLFLKYFNFFGGTINDVSSLFGGGKVVPTLHLLLPLGISFYTLQAISYMVDVYRGKIQADRNPFKFMLFMSFFPQIVQGPIPRYDQLARQLYEGHRFDYTQMCHGLQLAIWGLVKKLIIAERLAIPTNYLFANYSQYKGPIMLFASAFYGLQVYTDFSGGMDIARGVAQMLGIRLELNFVQPYFSSSIEEFWRRWHITMGSWMKDYIFYPLTLSKTFTTLSRKSRKFLGAFVGKRLPAFLAMFIVYFLVGFWHGPNWKYVVYGIWNGVFIMMGILLDETYAKCRNLCHIDENAVTWRVFKMLRTFLLVSFGRFFSGADNLQVALSMAGRMFQNWRDISFLYNGTLLDTGLNTANWFILCAFITLLFLVDFAHERKYALRETIDRQLLVFRWIIYITAVLILLIFGIYGPEYDASSFIYGQF